MSAFQELKWFIVHHLHVDKDGIHIYIGVACYLLAVTAGRLPASSWRALLPGVALSLLLEFIDVFETIRFGDPPAWKGGLWDLLNTNLTPVILWLCARRGLLERAARRSGRDERI